MRARIKVGLFIGFVMPFGVSWQLWVGVAMVSDFLGISDVWVWPPKKNKEYINISRNSLGTI